jgi:hypothetical protein
MFTERTMIHPSTTQTEGATNGKNYIVYIK